MIHQKTTDSIFIELKKMTVATQLVRNVKSACDENGETEDSVACEKAIRIMECGSLDIARALLEDARQDLQEKCIQGPSSNG